MDRPAPLGFFAYPSSPVSIGEAIRAAVQEINLGGLVRIKTWEDLVVAGKILISVICREIDQSELFCGDLTGLNANAMFELGYAIAKNKHIWPVLDPTFVSFKSQFEQFRTLTTLGYVPYTNSPRLVSEFYTAQPQNDEANRVFQHSILPGLHADAQNKLFYLKSRHETQASILMTRRIQRTGIPLIVDDPSESSIQYLAWYGANAFNSMGLICHLSHPDREGAVLHNARQSLVAGLGHGMGKPLLMLTEGDYLAPLDYRELLRQYDTGAEAVGYLDEWIEPIEKAWLEGEESKSDYLASIKLATELNALRLGEPIAENESAELVDYFFIETVAYREAVNGKHTIFVGRKGTGKTANFLKLAYDLGADRRILVCKLKPIAYQLQGITDLLGRYRELDHKTYAVESLWKFLLVTEIANSVVEMIRERPRSEADSDEAKLLELFERDDSVLAQDFSVRLERAVQALRDAQQRREPDKRSIEQDQLSISEALHGSLYKELRLILGTILSNNKKRVALLVDNLDKAWDKQSDLTSLAEFFLGLLSAAKRVAIDFGREDSRRDSADVSIAIFLRSDIFFKIANVAREPDKINSYKLTWDSELLTRVIEERFTALHAGTVRPDEVWVRYFCESIKGQPTREYFLERSLARPRDLLFFIKAAVAIAINRGRGKVEERDVLDAEKQYSQFAVESLSVENGLSTANLKDIIYEFLACEAVLTRSVVEGFLSKAGVQTESFVDVIRHLCSLSFLGIEVDEDSFRFSDDVQEEEKIEILGRKFSEQRGGEPRYMINKPYWAFLEIDS